MRISPILISLLGGFALLLLCFAPGVFAEENQGVSRVRSLNIIEKDSAALDQPIASIMSHHPKKILRSNLAAKALQQMDKFSITSLFVFEAEADTVPIGIIHLHDLLKAGVV